jgi:hypothetical protein
MVLRVADGWLPSSGSTSTSSAPAASSAWRRASPPAAPRAT